MRYPQYLFASIAILSSALCIVRPSAAQVVGCDGDGIKCHSEKANPVGICEPEITRNGIGVVSFESNVTSDGPLTWTVTVTDEKSDTNPHSDRYFWLGTPSSFNVSNISDFGGCAMILSNLTSALQIPTGYNDFQSFGCDTTMGASCTQDLTSLVHRELTEIIVTGSLDGNLNPCEAVGAKLDNTPFPESCQQIFTTEVPVYPNLRFQNGFDIIHPDYPNYPLQDGCVVTTGGPDYQIHLIPQDQRSGSVDSEEIRLFKNGTTPIFAMFYNEPWNNASTGPVSFLDSPEVHLRCIAVKQTAEQISGSTRLGSSIGNLGWAWLVFSVALWATTMN